MFSGTDSSSLIFLVQGKVSGEALSTLLAQWKTLMVDVKWLLPLGLAISSMVDILITLSLFLLLQKSRAKSTG
ncbi:hypothetical protein C0991_011009, partial [Blastosporella zonata]